MASLRLASRLPRPWTTALGSLVLASIVMAACTQAQIDAGRAVQVARDFIASGEPSDYRILQLTNQPPRLVGDHWTVYVDALVRIPGAPDTGLHYIIDVNRSSGAATIEAQG